VLEFAANAFKMLVADLWYRKTQDPGNNQAFVDNLVKLAPGTSPDALNMQTKLRQVADLLITEARTKMSNPNATTFQDQSFERLLDDIATQWIKLRKITKRPAMQFIGDAFKYYLYRFRTLIQNYADSKVSDAEITIAQLRKNSKAISRGLDGQVFGKLLVEQILSAGDAFEDASFLDSDQIAALSVDRLPWQQQPESVALSNITSALNVVLSELWGKAQDASRTAQLNLSGAFASLVQVQDSSTKSLREQLSALREAIVRELFDRKLKPGSRPPNAFRTQLTQPLKAIVADWIRYKKLTGSQGQIALDALTVYFGQLADLVVAYSEPQQPRVATVLSYLQKLSKPIATGLNGKSFTQLLPK